jgi:hypothetical protein
MADDLDPWDGLRSRIDALKIAISKSKAVNVNAATLRDDAQDTVQQYFRRARPDLIALGIAEAELATVDGEMQSLLALAQGRNLKRSYKRVLQVIGREYPRLSSLRERRLGDTASASRTQAAQSDGERRIINTLEKMLPHAAKSYGQALSDLGGARLSWRGTAVELRELVREVLDHLAPDDAVMKETGFKLEKDRRAPTMKQKASFILRARGLSSTSRKAPQDAISVVDELTATFVRSAYDRGSASTHGTPEKADVERLKMYVDLVLTELFENR